MMADVVTFSITEGGPGTKLMKRLRLIRPELGYGSIRTALILGVVTWAPLLVLSLAEGLAFGRVKMPFIYDIFAHVRFLLTVPTLVLAEIPISARLRAVVRHMIEAPLIDEKDLTRFEQIVHDTVCLRDSRAAELAILGLSYFLTYLALNGVSFLGNNTWFRLGPGDGLTLVGYWYALVSLPVYQFLIFRWIYRIMVWTWFIWNVSRLELLLTPIHPDEAGGLAFLGKSMLPFGLILFALSAAISGAIGSRILFEGARFEEFQWSYVALMVLGLVVISAPLLVLVPTLLRLKQRGLIQYAAVASRYTQAFQSSRVAQTLFLEGPLPDLSQIQSLESFAKSFERIRNMKVIPIQLSDVIAIALPAVIPGLPLLATVMPLEEILKSLFKMVV